jgi:hypothetical protein
MSVRIDVDKLAETASHWATVPMLLTTDPDGRPRASAVTVTWDGPDAVVRAGHRSVDNAADRPLVSLLWPAAPGDPHALLIDGERTEASDGTVRLRATSGILHVVNR